MTLDYFVTSILVILLPGTGVLYTLACGLGRGWKASMLAAFGCTLGIVPHIAASLLGLAALLHASALAFEILKYLGAAYLFYMAWSVLRGGGALEAREDRPGERPGRLILTGVLLNLLNPKLTLFFLAFLPQFVAPDASGALADMLVLSGVFMGLTFAIFALYGIGAAFARARIVSRPGVMRWLSRGVAAAFVMLGLRLALPEG